MKIIFWTALVASCWYLQFEWLLTFVVLVNIVSFIITTPIREYNELYASLGTTPAFNFMNTPDELVEYIGKWYVRTIPYSVVFINILVIVFIAYSMFSIER